LPGYLLLEHPDARDVFPRYAAAGYYVTRTMVPLMEAALERARALAPGDPVAAGVAEYLERHIPEEMHGEEAGRAALDDLEALGIDGPALVAQPPPAKIVALVGAQYFWVFHYHPVTILGHLELEAYHPRRATIERLIEQTGLPHAGFRQLLLHARLDVVHAKELHHVLDSLPLAPEQEQMIGLSALHTIAQVVDVLLDVVRERATGELQPLHAHV
jgi:hypothetical protein